MEFGVAEDYAIRFLMYLSKYPDRVIPRWEISEVMRIPKAFLAKIAQTLEVAGIVEIRRGKKGGYRLKKRPAEVSLLEIIESIRGKIALNRCIENPQVCFRSSFCPVHFFWKEVNEKFRKMLKEQTLENLIKKEEEILTYALYPQIAVKFLRGELKAEPIPKEKDVSKFMEVPTEYIVDVNGEKFNVRIEPVWGTELKEKEKKEIITAETEGAVLSPFRGMITKIKVKEGDTVKKGDVIAILEAMKMENPIESPVDGKVEKILVHEGQSVNVGDVIMIIK